jgi:hypothetical protein
MTRPPADASSLMGRVYLANTSQDSWIGGYRTGSVAPSGWLWVDGISASNLNCGSAGCGPWAGSEPTGDPENRAHIWVVGLGLNDRPDASLQSYTCEIEVCGPGQYLGPNFTTGCLQCPAGLYSVGGAVGGCTQCPPGTFGSSPGLSTPACSGNCSTAAGSACLAGSTSATGTLCPVGQYSPSGASSCTLCPSPTPFSSPGSGSCFAACPDATWTPWVDVGGVEGAHSCFKRFSDGLSWTAASEACVALGGGSHLLTSRQVSIRDQFRVCSKQRRYRRGAVVLSLMCVLATCYKMQRLGLV